MVSRLWKFLNTDIRKLFSLDTVDGVVGAVDAASILAETLDKQEIQDIAPWIEKWASFLDLLNTPEAELIESILPFAKIATGLLKFYTKKTEKTPPPEQGAILACIKAYAESLISFLDGVQATKKINETKSQKLDSLKNIEINESDAEQALLNFPYSKLAGILSTLMTQRLESVGLNSEEAKLLCTRAIWNTHRYITKHWNSLPSNLRQFGTASLIERRDEEQKYQAIERYLKNNIKSQPDNCVYQGREFGITYRDFYVQLEIQPLTRDGAIDESSTPVNVHEWVIDRLEITDDIREQKTSRKIMLIEGEIGRGKTIFCSMFAEWTREKLFPIFIPVIFSLDGNLSNFQGSLSQAISTHLKNRNFSKIEDCLDDRNNRFLIFLDGFDKLLLEGLKDSEGFLEKIVDFQRNSHHQFLVTSCPLPLRKLNRFISRSESFDWARIEPMNSSIQSEWIKRWAEKMTISGEALKEFRTRQLVIIETKRKDWKNKIGQKKAEEEFQKEVEKLQKKEIDEAEAMALGRALEFSKVLELLPNDIRDKLAYEPPLLHSLASFYLRVLDPIASKNGQNLEQIILSGETSEKVVLRRKNLEDALLKRKVFYTSIIHKALVEWIIEMKLQDKCVRINNINSESLKIFLGEIAMLSISSSGGGIKIDMLETIFNHENYISSGLIKQTMNRSGQFSKQVIDNLLNLFYFQFKEKKEENLISFVHEDLRDFLCADLLKEKLTSWSIYQRDYQVEASQFEKDVYNLLCYGRLTSEIVDHLITLLVKDAVNLWHLFQRLKKFYFNWCDGKYIDQSTNENLILNKLIELEEVGVARGMRQLDIDVGLNVMILLLALHKYARVVPAQESSIEKLELNFHPCREPEEELDPDRLLRIIGYCYCINKEASNSSVTRRFVDNLKSFLSNVNFSGINLQAVDFSDVDLRYADLSGANLSRANLRRTKLNKADLQNANLCGADLREADLEDAKLQGADLRDANLIGLDLSKLDLQSANLSGLDLSRFDLTDTNLSGAKLSGSNLRGLDLSGLDLNNVDFRNATLNDTILIGAALSGANLSELDLRGSDLSDANLANAQLIGVDLSEAFLHNTNLEEADLSNSNLSDAYLSGANLSKAKLNNVNLSGANLESIKCEETNWEGVIGLESAKNLPESCQVELLNQS